MQYFDTYHTSVMSSASCCSTERGFVVGLEGGMLGKSSSGTPSIQRDMPREYAASSKVSHFRPAFKKSLAEQDG